MPLVAFSSLTVHPFFHFLFSTFPLFHSFHSFHSFHPAKGGIHPTQP